MKTLFDTSVLIAALVESHPMHESAFPWLKQARERVFEMVVAAHTVAELYAVLSTLPVRPRIAPEVAWRLINVNVETIGRIVSLTSREYGSTIKRVADSGLSGGAVYDAIIARVARKAKVDRLLTFNGDHFRRVWPMGESVIVTPQSFL